jgi:hypothetical protein
MWKRVSGRGCLEHTWLNFCCAIDDSSHSHMKKSQNDEQIFFSASKHLLIILEDRNLTRICRIRTHIHTHTCYSAHSLCYRATLCASLPLIDLTKFNSYIFARLHTHSHSHTNTHIHAHTHTHTHTYTHIGGVDITLLVVAIQRTASETGQQCVLLYSVKQLSDVIFRQDAFLSVFVFVYVYVCLSVYVCCMFMFCMCRCVHA